MLSWALFFFIFAVVAGVLGFGGIAATSAGIAQVLFYIFVGLFVLSLLMRLAKKGDEAIR
mgnify:FL=1